MENDSKSCKSRWENVFLHPEIHIIYDAKTKNIRDIEVKAKSAQAKSIATVRKHPEKYGVRHFIKFGDYNIGRNGDLLTLPTYMQFLLDLEPEDVTLEAIDTDKLALIAKEFLGK